MGLVGPSLLSMSSFMYASQVHPNLSFQNLGELISFNYGV